MPTQSSFAGARFDPYKNFKFRLRFEGRSEYFAGLSKCSELKRPTQNPQYRTGAAFGTGHVGGRSQWDAITLDRGVTHDQEFESWARSAAGLARSGPIAAGFRKEVVLDVFNEAGQKFLSYKIHRCWVSEIQAFPDFDRGGHAVAIQHIRLENEGWDRA